MVIAWDCGIYPDTRNTLKVVQIAPFFIFLVSRFPWNHIQHQQQQIIKAALQLTISTFLFRCAGQRSFAAGYGRLAGRLRWMAGGFLAPLPASRLLPGPPPPREQRVFICTRRRAMLSLRRASPAPTFTLLRADCFPHTPGGQRWTPVGGVNN